MHNPTYDDVVQGESGHAEVVKVTFNSREISLEKVLTIFFHAHDPTTRNRQGNDIGSQYRSLILYSNNEQLRITNKVLADIATKKVWKERPLVTEIAPLGDFYAAEDYHQDYYNKNPKQQYCALVIGPKIYKIKQEFKELLR